MTHVLVLGGTTEASALARALADAGVSAVFSYAGRTDAPVAQPLPTRIGGFGGVAGLADYLSANRVTHVIDATHPFAAQMSRNAIDACALTATPLLGFERMPWLAGPSDHWQQVPDIAAAVLALPQSPARVFLAIGKQNVSAFALLPQHHYLLRLVDPPSAPLPFPDAHVVLARGPFDTEGDLDLLRAHRISHIVAKNSGGSGALAKIDAARLLQLPVIMVDRPVLQKRAMARSVAEVMAWLGHPARLGV